MLVFCAGMPKAGSTLQYNLSKDLLGVSLKTDHGWVTAAAFAKGFMPDPGTDDSHAIVKCHTVPRPIAESLPRRQIRILSSRRDLRDVAASDRDFTAGKTFEETLVTLAFHVEQLQRLATYDSCLIQRYETMIDDLPRIVRELADHLDRSPSEDEVQAMAARWGVDAVRERIDAGTRTPVDRPGVVRRVVGRVTGRAAPDDPKWDKDTLLWPTHISQAKGRHGRYQGVLTPEEIALIEDRYGDWLREHGYL